MLDILGALGGGGLGDDNGEGSEMDLGAMLAMLMGGMAPEFAIRVAKLENGKFIAGLFIDDTPSFVSIAAHDNPTIASAYLDQELCLLLWKITGDEKYVERGKAASDKIKNISGTDDEFKAGAAQLLEFLDMDEEYREPFDYKETFCHELEDSNSDECCGNPESCDNEIGGISDICLSNEESDTPVNDDSDL